MCYGTQNAVPVEVAMYGEELPVIGATVQVQSPYSTGEPYVAQVLGFERFYGVTNVTTVRHAESCPVRCISTRVRLSEIV